MKNETPRTVGILKAKVKRSAGDAAKGNLLEELMFIRSASSVTDAEFILNSGCSSSSFKRQKQWEKEGVSMPQMDTILEVIRGMLLLIDDSSCFEEVTRQAVLIVLRDFAVVTVDHVSKSEFVITVKWIHNS